MNKAIGHFLATTDEEYWPANAVYSTRQEAIDNAVKDLDLESGQTFFTGQAVECDPVDPFDAEFIIDNARDQLGEQVGEIADEAYEATNAQVKILGERLYKVWLDWQKEFNCEPACFTVEDQEEHKAPGEPKEVPERTTTGIHDPSACEGQFCCYHNPSNHHMKEWPKVLRASTLVERICPHEIGHPDPDSLAHFHRSATTQEQSDFSAGLGIHGCDGCCDPQKGAA